MMHLQKKRKKFNDKLLAKQNISINGWMVSAWVLTSDGTHCLVPSPFGLFELVETGDKECPYNIIQLTR